MDNELEAREPDAPTVAERLLAAREGQGLTLADIATKTRIPLRHLQAMEAGEFSALPSITYALGFTRSYARALGLEERSLVEDLRYELGRTPVPQQQALVVYEPSDPARLPGRWLAWGALLLGLAIVGGYLAWRSTWLNQPVPGEQIAAPAPVEAAVTPLATAPAAAPAATGTGTVVLTAREPVWVRVTSGATKLKEGVLQAGERFELPRDARDVRARVGDPSALDVTVDGRAVPALGPAGQAVTVPVDAASLLARAPVPTAAPVGAMQ